MTLGRKPASNVTSPDPRSLTTSFPKRYEHSLSDRKLRFDIKRAIKERLGFTPERCIQGKSWALISRCLQNARLTMTAFGKPKLKTMRSSDKLVEIRARIRKTAKIVTDSGEIAQEWTICHEREWVNVHTPPSSRIIKVEDRAPALTSCWPRMPAALADRSVQSVSLTSGKILGQATNAGTLYSVDDFQFGSVREILESQTSGSNPFRPCQGWWAPEFIYWDRTSNGGLADWRAKWSSLSSWRAWRVHNWSKKVRRYLCLLLLLPCLVRYMLLWNLAASLECWIVLIMGVERVFLHWPFTPSWYVNFHGSCWHDHLKTCLLKKCLITLMLKQ